MNASRMAGLAAYCSTMGTPYSCLYSSWYRGMAGHLDMGLDAPFDYQPHYHQLRRSDQPTGQIVSRGTDAPSKGIGEGTGRDAVLERRVFRGNGHWQKVSQPSWQAGTDDSHQATLNRRLLARLLRFLGRAVLPPDFKIPPPPPLPPDMPPPSKSDEALRKRAIRELALLRYELNEVLSVIDHKAPPDEP
jgi:hypothetical protein